MQTRLLLNGMILFAVLIVSCRNQEAIIAPECPSCWDEKMVCVESTCQCPEGYLETWLNLYRGHGEDLVPPLAGRKFCIKPDKLTFMAHFPKFECIDTFAIRFYTEPLEVTDQTQILLVSSVEPQVPKSWTALPPGLILDTKDPKGVWVGIPSLYPTHGTSFLGCIDYDLNGSIDGGIGRISFRGYFTHPDTISGHLLFEGASGSKAALENYQLEGIKLIRTVPY